MSAGKHTPGPWRLIVDDGYAYILPREGHQGAPQGVTGFPIRGAGICSAESLANANLIAAATDLLEALRANHHWHLDYDETGTYAGSELEAQNLAAIAKATGQEGAAA